MVRTWVPSSWSSKTIPTMAPSQQTPHISGPERIRGRICARLCICVCVWRASHPAIDPLYKQAGEKHTHRRKRPCFLSGFPCSQLPGALKRSPQTIAPPPTNAPPDSRGAASPSPPSAPSPRTPNRRCEVRAARSVSRGWSGSFGNFYPPQFLSLFQGKAKGNQAPSTLE